MESKISNRLVIKPQSATGLFKIDTSEFPLVTLEVNKVKDISEKEIDHTFTMLHNFLNKSYEPFVLFIDAGEASWLQSKYRDIVGVRMNYLTEEYASRYKKTFIYVPNLMVYILRKLITGFLKPTIPVKVSFNKEELKLEAKGFVARLNS